MTWRTVAICDACWFIEETIARGEVREPVKLKEPETERCYSCGVSTTSGIYVRREVP